jgi:hypothetical protein
MHTLLIPISKGGSMLQLLSYRKAVVDAFPEIQFDSSWTQGFILKDFFFSHLQ